MMRKIQASGEVHGKLMGTIDTKEKFETKRLELAEHEWARMKASDSRECRNCHSFEGMNTEKQNLAARKCTKSPKTKKRPVSIATKVLLTASQKV